MKVTVESTSKMLWLEKDGARIPVRVWQGTTSKGTRVSMLVARIMPDDLDKADPNEFAKDLQKYIEPTEYWVGPPDVIPVTWTKTN